MTRSIFYGVPAYVGAITGETQCGFWPLYPTTFDPTKLIPVDLARSPQGVRAGRITAKDVQIDDNIAGQPDPGLSTTGPRFMDGAIQGAAWLESTYFDNLPPSLKPDRVPKVAPDTMQCRDYELTSVLYWDGALANRRFYGLYAEIVVRDQGGLTQVTIWPAGKSLVPGIAPAGTFWLDLAKSALPIEPGFTQIGIAPTDPQQGALFLDRPTAAALALTSPKLPPHLGSDFF